MIAKSAQLKTNPRISFSDGFFQSYKSQPNEAKTNKNSEEKSNRPREGAIKRRHNIPPRPDSPENTEIQNLIVDEQEDSVVQPGEVDLDSQPEPVIVRNSRRKPRPRRDS